MTAREEDGSELSFAARLVFDHFFPGTPESAPRPRTTTIQGDAAGSKAYSRIYRPVTDWRKFLDKAVKSDARLVALTGKLDTGKPVRAVLRFYFARPQDHYRSNGELKDWAPRFCMNDKDFDNLAKELPDALAPIIGDDRKIVDGRSVKLYCRGDEQPGCRVQLYELDDAAKPAKKPKKKKEVDNGKPVRAKKPKRADGIKLSVQLIRRPNPGGS